MPYAFLGLTLNPGLSRARALPACRERTVPYAPAPSFQSEPSSLLQMWMSRGSISQSLHGSAGSALLWIDAVRPRLPLADERSDRWAAERFEVDARPPLKCPAGPPPTDRISAYEGHSLSLWRAACALSFKD